MNLNDWTAIGLIYDIFGVIILGYALAFTSVKRLIDQAGTRWSSNRVAFDALVNQRTDARFGVLLLVVGFLMQILGAVGCAFLVNGWIILLVILACLGATLFPLRRYALNRARRKRDELTKAQHAS